MSDPMSVTTYDPVLGRPVVDAMREHWRSGAFRNCLDLLNDATLKQCVALLPLMRAVINQHEVDEYDG